MMENYHCCRPFRDNGKICSSKRRKVTDSMIEHFVSKQCVIPVNTTMQICDSCRLYSYRHVPVKSAQQLAPIDNEMPDNTTASLATSGNDLKGIPLATSRYDLEEIPSAASLVSTSSRHSNLPDDLRNQNVEVFNKGISGINVSPIAVRELRSDNYRQEKYSKIVEGIRKQLFDHPPQNESEEVQTVKSKAAAFDEIINKLKEKFSQPNCSRDDKIRILSILPNSWSVTMTMKEFNVNKYTVSLAKELVEEQGILAVPNKKCGRPLDPEIKREVLQFFNDDDISRTMPGQRDYVSTRTNSGREQVQKRLLLSSLRETFQRFEEVSKHQISFSLFAALRPNHCKLLNTSGYHNVCVCTIHENVDLMLHSLKKYSFQIDCKPPSEKLLCNSSIRTKDCYFRDCKKCPTSSILEESLLEELEQKIVNEISFEQWVTTDRCNLEILTKPVDDFVAYLTEKLEKLVTHDYIKNNNLNF